MKKPEPLYDKIGVNYNATRNADPYIVQKIHDLLNPELSMVYLDIGCGTGNYTIEFANKGLNFIGVEPSEKMLMEARLKSKAVNWVLGAAESIPANDGSFDGGIATLTIHHWTNLDAAFKEVARVLKNGSKFIIFTAFPRQMKGYWLNHYFPQMMAKSMKTMPSLEDIRKSSELVGFKLKTTEVYEIKAEPVDLFLYSGKHHPSLYLDPEIRKGISSFSVLAHQHEVEEGIGHLHKDIQNDVFQNVAESFDNKLGDYVFVVLQKK